MDLRFINKSISKDYIKFESWDIFWNYLSPAGWGFQFDLKHGYHHIKLNPKSQIFCGFAWETNGNTEYFVFTALPFGLAPAAYCFTKVLRPLTKFWRGQGIKIAVYLDDGADMEDQREKAVAHAKIVQNTLTDAGFVVNTEKTNWAPSQTLTWLGFTVDTQLQRCYVTPKRINRIQHTISHLITNTITTARKLAAFTGSLVSTKFVLGDIVSLKTRGLYQAISQQTHWDTKLNLASHKLAQEEILFWENNLSDLNCKLFRKPLATPTLYCSSDASDKALGVIFNDLSCHRNLSGAE